MNNTDNDINQVERFFDAEMGDQEVKLFKERLESDPDLKALYDQEKTIIYGIKRNAIQDNLNYLKKLETTLPTVSQTTNKLRWYYAAAATLAVFILGYWFTSYNESPEKLYQAYFKPYTNAFDATTRSDDAITPRTEAFQAYDNANYERAAVLFRELLKEKEEPGILMLLGNSNLILGNTEEAKQNFITLYKHFDELDMPAKWYLSLCYLKSGDVESARTILNELGETEVSYAEKAKELLHKVD